MSNVVETFYLCERYTVDWDKVDEWFNKRIADAFKEANK